MKSYKIGVTGYKGLIGSELVNRIGVPLDCDIRDAQSIKQALDKVKPDIVINCAAKTDTNFCEKNTEEAIHTNVRGPFNLIDNLSEQQLLVHLSTSYVFDGNRSSSYWESDKPNPINLYGLSKWAGESIVEENSTNFLIIRTSKTINRKWMDITESRLKSGDVIQLYRATRSFVHVSHFVTGLLYLIDLKMNGRIDNRIINLAGTENISYYRFWKYAAKVLGYDESLILPDYKVEPSIFPYNAGLDVRVAKKLKTPLFSYMEGLNLMAEEKLT
jgi:dTDP-4-dehydrorhamnose reductase